MKLALNWLALPEEVDRISKELPGLELRYLASPDTGPRVGQAPSPPVDDLTKLVKDAEILLAFGVIPRPSLASADALRFLSLMEHGCDALPLDVLRAKGVTVANAHGAWDHAVAEQAMAFLLALAKRLEADHQALVDARWQAQWIPGETSVGLAGQTIGIFGYGGIGRQVAAIAKAFGMKVLAIRRSAGDSDGVVDEVHGSDDLLKVLPRCRFVVVVAPLTQETLNKFDERALQAMRPDAFLINVGRAGVVAERPLYEGLTKGWIAGFASCVWWDYGYTAFGIPSRLGVHRLPNVIGVGDRSNNIEGAFDYMLGFGIANVAAYVAGRPPGHTVDLELGY